MRVLIAGGGIGGLTSAIALQKRGIEVQVFEAASSFDEVGAGIWMAPNALQVFDRLGLLEAIGKAGMPYRKGVAITRLDGTVLSESKPVPGSQGATAHTIAIHRARLHEILLAEVGQTTANKRVQKYQFVNDGVIATFTDGTTATGDILIGADGLRSQVRQQMFGETPLRYSGQTCWRFLSPATNESMQRDYDMTEIWGDAGGLRVGIGLVSDDQIYTYVTAKASAGGVLDPRTVKGDLLQLCGSFPPSVLELIEQVPGDSILRNDLYDFEPLRVWHDDRVVLVGDAAHATLPNLGQGACQAVESGYSLAAQLDNTQSPLGDISRAFKEYEAQRMAKAHRVTKMSRQIGLLSNIDSSMGRRLRDLSFRLTPAIVSRRVQNQLNQVAPDRPTT